jgi:hypothetical protein
MQEEEEKEEEEKDTSDGKKEGRKTGCQGRESTSEIYKFVSIRKIIIIARFVNAPLQLWFRW